MGTVLHALIMVLIAFSLLSKYCQRNAKDKNDGRSNTRTTEGNVGQQNFKRIESDVENKKKKEGEEAERRSETEIAVAGPSWVKTDWIDLRCMMCFSEQLPFKAGKHLSFVRCSKYLMEKKPSGNQK